MEKYREDLPETSETPEGSLPVRPSEAAADGTLHFPPLADGSPDPTLSHPDDLQWPGFMEL